jgi:lipopolysaccharide transport system ATP-binding protein
VKRYSSGMHMRLAFAVAAHLESEILFVDEVLAVGDSVFQKKCLGKMNDVARAGRTVLFVSHNTEAIAAITQRGMVLSNGNLVYQGATMEALAEYQRQTRTEEPHYVDDAHACEPRITRVEVRTTNPNNVHVHGEPLEVHFDIVAPVAINGASLSFLICNPLKQPATYLWTYDSERPMCRRPGMVHLVCRIPKAHLYMGHYTLTAYFSERPGGVRFQILENICPFEVVMYGKTNDFGWHPGLCTYVEQADWEIEDRGDCPAAAPDPGTTEMVCV